MTALAPLGGEGNAAPAQLRGVGVGSGAQRRGKQEKILFLAAREASYSSSSSLTTDFSDAEIVTVRVMSFPRSGLISRTL